jgi:peptide/nickel transport system permease protein
MTSSTNAQNLSGGGKVLSLGDSAQTQRGVSNLERSLYRLRKHRMAMVGAGILIGMLVWIIVWSLVIPEPISRLNDPARKLQTPSTEHWFGTDQIGRDIFARTIYGGQISLFIGVTAVLLQITVGAVVGLIAGYMGGIVDSALMRIAEAMLSIPQLFLALIAVRIFAGRVADFRVGDRDFSSTLVIMIFVIGLTSWMRISRIVRSVVLSLKEQEFVTAARSIGVPTNRVLLRHVLPNCLAPIIVSATLGVASAILLEAYLSFLGFGVRAPTPTWGNIIGDSYRFMSEWYFWFFPAMYIVLTVLGINFFGDGLRDAFDPKSLK